MVLQSLEKEGAEPSRGVCRAVKQCGFIMT